MDMAMGDMDMGMDDGGGENTEMEYLSFKKKRVCE